MKNNYYGFNYQELFLLSIAKPTMVQIEITRNCNQKCYFCFRSCNPNRKYKDKTLECWKNSIDKLITIGVREINFSGGEVFLYKNLSDLLKYFKLNGITKIIVNTNGQIDPQNDLLENIDELVFSVHGLGKNHDKVTGIVGSFEKTCGIIERVTKASSKVAINTVVTLDNYQNLEEIYRFFQRYPLLFHSFNLSIDRKNLVKKLTAYQEMIPVYLDFLKKLPTGKIKLRHGMQNIMINDKDYYRQSYVPLPHCAGGKYKLVIDYKGDIYPCRYFQTKDYYCGNIFTDDLRKVWRFGKGFKFFRDIVLKEKLPSECTTCLKKKKCVGGCLSWRIFNNSLNLYEKDIRCQFGNSYIGDRDNNSL